MTSTSPFQVHQFTILMLLIHIIFITIFTLYGRFDSQLLPGAKNSHEYLNTKYSMFQDTHVMIFVGFGFLMTFLRRYGFSAISINMLVACVTIEWGIIVRGFLGHEFHEHGYFTIGLEQLFTADFAAAVVLISMGAMLGKLSPIQYVIMALIETPAAITVEHYLVHSLHINDIGGSIVVHIFGAYFGLACAKGFAKEVQREHQHEGSIYHSDIFAMIGTLFLWVFWPSFNAAMAEPADARHRAITNTFLALVGCTLASMIASQAVDHKKRFNMVHMANATIAGGVAIGSTANVVLDPALSLGVGSVAGVVSVIGYQYITPFLTHKLRIHDTCGVHNLHGMPGVISGLFSVVVAVIYDRSKFADSLAIIYPGMAPVGSTNGLDENGQALTQLLAVVIALIASIVFGFITGLFLRLNFINQVRDRELYSDGEYFEAPNDYDFTTRIMARIDHVEITDKTPLKSVPV